jgi:beta-glucanase (GH16 family)
LLPTDLRYGGYLHSGEIDIAERVGYDAKLVHSTIHTYANNSVKDNAITASTRLTRKDDGFHIYAMLWTEDDLSIFVDGVRSLNYPRPEGATSSTWPFDVPFHIILNLAVGGSWGRERNRRRSIPAAYVCRLCSLLSVGQFFRRMKSVLGSDSPAISNHN